MFQKATREQAKLRVGIEGPAKSGKTFTALVLATAAVGRFGGRIAFIDTERGSAKKYAPKPGQQADGKQTFDFDAVEFGRFSPTEFIRAIEEADKMGYTVLIVDSLSHEWMGTGGVLQMVESADDKNQFAKWRTPSALHTKLVDAMLQSNLHLIATMRSKMAYDQVENPKTGKKEIVKLGLQPVQRDGMEYEFDIVLSMDTENNCRVSGSRCPDMPNSLTENCPAGSFFLPLLDWVSEGAEPAPKPRPIEREIKSKLPDYPKSWTAVSAKSEKDYGIDKKDFRAIADKALAAAGEEGNLTDYQKRCGMEAAIRFAWDALLANRAGQAPADNDGQPTGTEPIMQPPDNSPAVDYDGQPMQEGGA